MHRTIPMLLLVLGVIVLLNLAVLPKLPVLLYPLARQAAQLKLEYNTKDYSTIETEHFNIRYNDGDKAMAKLVADSAEQAYKPVTGLLGKTLTNKTLIIVQPNRREMQKAFGWSGDQSAMGVYWGGVIQVLSPGEWLQDGQTAEDFFQTGPLVHELTHLLFDKVTNGNYPRWFTEGVAQYAEFQITGYEWLTKTNSLSTGIYTQKELEKLDTLPDQSLAYRTSFAAVRYIADTYGEAALWEISKQLGKGRAFPKVLETVLNIDYKTFGTRWQDWATKHM